MGMGYEKMKHLFIQHYKTNYPNLQNEPEDVFDTFMRVHPIIEYQKVVQERKEAYMDDFLDDLAEHVPIANTLEPYPLY